MEKDELPCGVIPQVRLNFSAFIPAGDRLLAKSAPLRYTKQQELE
jgi:hypothetical protein